MSLYHNEFPAFKISQEKKPSKTISWLLPAKKSSLALLESVECDFAKWWLWTQQKMWFWVCRWWYQQTPCSLANHLCQRRKQSKVYSVAALILRFYIKMTNITHDPLSLLCALWYIFGADHPYCVNIAIRMARALDVHPSRIMEMLRHRNDPFLLATARFSKFVRDRLRAHRYYSAFRRSLVTSATQIYAVNQ